MKNYLDFEKEVKALEQEVDGLKSPFGSEGISEVDTQKIKNTQNEINEKLKETYANLNSWQRTQVARHEDRPKANFYIKKIFSQFTLLSGDRYFGDDKSVIAGFGLIDNKSVLVIGQEKGDDLESRISLFEKNRSIHQLNTKLGLFLLNHDGGKYSRPYSQQLLTTVITDRLAFLELVTHTVFFKMIELEKIMLVASGPAVLKEKITNSLRQNSRKFGVNFSLLFIKCESSKFGVEPPSASYSNGDLKLTFYPEHPFYGNVAQNWTLLREKTILLAKKMIKNNLTFNLSSL